MEDSEDSFGMDSEFTNVFDSQNSQQLEEPKSPFEWDHPSLSPLSENAEAESNEQQQLDSTEIYTRDVKSSLELEDISEDEKVHHQEREEDLDQNKYGAEGEKDQDDDGQEMFQEKTSEDLGNECEEGSSEYHDDTEGMGTDNVEDGEADETGEYTGTQESSEYADAEMNESGELAEADESGELAEADESGELAQANESGEIAQANEGGELAEADESGEYVEAVADESGEHVEANKETENFDKSAERDLGGEGKEIAEPDDSLKQVDDPNESAEPSQESEMPESKKAAGVPEHEEDEVNIGQAIGDKLENVGAGEDSSSLKVDDETDTQKVKDVHDNEGGDAGKDDENEEKVESCGKVDQRPGPCVDSEAGNTQDSGKSNGGHSSKKYSEKKRHRSGKLKKHKKKRSKIERRFSSTDDTPDELQNLDDILKRLEDLPLDNESNKTEDDDPDKLPTTMDQDQKSSKLENELDDDDEAAVPSISITESSVEDETTSGSASSINDNVEQDKNDIKSPQSSEENASNNLEETAEAGNSKEHTENNDEATNGDFSWFKDRLKGVCLERLNLNETFHFLDKELKINFPVELTNGEYTHPENSEETADENGLDAPNSNEGDSNVDKDHESEENVTTLKTNSDANTSNNTNTELNKAEIGEEQSRNGVSSKKGKKNARKGSKKSKLCDTDDKSTDAEPEQNEDVQEKNDDTLKLNSGATTSNNTSTELNKAEMGAEQSHDSVSSEKGKKNTRKGSKKSKLHDTDEKPTDAELKQNEDVQEKSDDINAADEVNPKQSKDDKDSTQTKGKKNSRNVKPKSKFEEVKDDKAIGIIDIESPDKETSTTENQKNETQEPEMATDKSADSTPKKKRKGKRIVSKKIKSKDIEVEPAEIVLEANEDVQKEGDNAIAEEEENPPTQSETGDVNNETPCSNETPVVGKRNSRNTKKKSEAGDVDNEKLVVGKRNSRNTRKKSDSVQVEGAKDDVNCDTNELADKETSAIQDEATEANRNRPSSRRKAVKRKSKPVKEDNDNTVDTVTETSDKELIQGKGDQSNESAVSSKREITKTKSEPNSESKTDYHNTDVLKGHQEKTVRRTRSRQSKYETNNSNSGELDNNQSSNQPESIADDQDAGLPNGHAENESKRAKARPSRTVTKISPTKVGRSSKRLSGSSDKKTPLKVANETNSSIEDPENEMPVKRLRGSPLSSKTRNNIDEQDEMCDESDDSVQKLGRKSIKSKNSRKRSAGTDDVVDKSCEADYSGIKKHQTDETDATDFDHSENMLDLECFSETVRECTVQVSRLSFPIYCTLRRCAVSVDQLPNKLVPTEGACIFLSQDLIMKYCSMTVCDKSNTARERKPVVKFELPMPKTRVITKPKVSPDAEYQPKRSSRKTTSPYKTRRKR